MGSIDFSWRTLQAFIQIQAFRDLDIDCTVVGLSTQNNGAVQIKEVLYLDGEIHEAPEILRRHCASLIAVWAAGQTATLIDLDQCACVGRQFEPREFGLGRRFAIHAVPFDATQWLFVVISYASQWSDIGRVKKLIVELATKAKQIHAVAGFATCLPPSLIASGFDWHRFTSREVEILKLVASGLSNKQIARQLGSSPNTVRNQIHAVFQKAGVSNRTELALRVASADLS